MSSSFLRPDYYVGPILRYGSSPSSKRSLNSQASFVSNDYKESLGNELETNTQKSLEHVLSRLYPNGSGSYGTLLDLEPIFQEPGSHLWLALPNEGSANYQTSLYGENTTLSGHYTPRDGIDGTLYEYSTTTPLTPEQQTVLNRALFDLDTFRMTNFLLIDHPSITRDWILEESAAGNLMAILVEPGTFRGLATGSSITSPQWEHDGMNFTNNWFKVVASESIVTLHHNHLYSLTEQLELYGPIANADAITRFTSITSLIMDSGV